ncbi:Tim17/Tim22/Tim23/Pmp24 family [Sesbania bispinosa]|nr:Tim17/Tim22/Tim23/Pmp24 family [Sesbania bispinosa]
MKGEGEEKGDGGFESQSNNDSKHVETGKEGHAQETNVEEETMADIKALDSIQKSLEKLDITSAAQPESDPSKESFEPNKGKEDNKSTQALGCKFTWSNGRDAKNLIEQSKELSILHHEVSSHTKQMRTLENKLKDADKWPSTPENIAERKHLLTSYDELLRQNESLVPSTALAGGRAAAVSRRRSLLTVAQVPLQAPSRHSLIGSAFDRTTTTQPKVRSFTASQPHRFGRHSLTVSPGHRTTLPLRLLAKAVKVTVVANFSWLFIRISTSSCISWICALPMADDSGTAASNGSLNSKEVEKPPIEPLRLPTVEEIRGQDIWNNCAMRSVVSGVMGGGLGIFMGLFLGALDNPLMQEEMTGRQQLIYQAKQMGRRSWSSAKAFAVMGFIFSAAECVVEKARAKHDTTNTVVAGCVTGGAISAKGGPKAACAGCAGFAAFSVVIEKFLERHE